MIPFGPLKIDPIELGSSGNAILGIRASGKTSTATYLAEQLYAAGVPFIAFDPIGVFRFLRVPGKGRGIPVVVAGGESGDLPLTPASAPAIVEAAMQSGVSLVIDLYDIHLSKADWRRIVRDCVRLLLHRNKAYGLRHIFIEEAAEFAPQKVTDGLVYAEMEKLARMGGNAQLGYTLINQRSEEVNKALLELCDNLFLHRQKGRNSLTALGKWLDVGAVKDGKAIIDTLSTLPTGECWAWLAQSERPVHVKVPLKNSIYPDRKTMHGAEGAAIAKAVDVGKFVETLKAALPGIEEKAKADDPAHLRRVIADLQMNARNRAVPVVDTEALNAEYRRGYGEGQMASLEADTKERQDIRDRAVAIRKAADTLLDAINATRESAVVPQRPEPPRRVPVHADPNVAYVSQPAAKPSGAAPERILKAVAWWHARGHDAPTRVQVAFLARYSPRSSGYEKQVSNLSSAGEITFPAPGCLALRTGLKVATPANGTAVEAVQGVLSPRMWRVLQPLLKGKTLTRAQLADASEYSDRSSGYEKTISQLKGLSVIEFPSQGHVKAAEWLLEVR